ncbi:DUF4192 family protein [Leucobacter komagatae]|uniref:DUF4192 family protein n=1 Tax=Leucobacter komagatae TaxID=55969 RepID=UPI0012ED0CB0|nr:DUF4192 family protein [Leucobacter komagatae]
MTHSPATPAPPDRVVSHSAAAPQRRPEVLKCDTTADFLAALPRLVGFTAPDSLFIVLFSGSRAQSTVRVDLPDSEAGPEVAAYLDELVACLRSAQDRFGASPPAVVISSSLSFAEARGAPWRRFAQSLERLLARNGQRPRELCCIAPDAWVSFYDQTPPRFGRPLAEIMASRVHGGGQVPTLSELGAFRDISAAERAAIAHPAQQRDGCGADAEPERQGQDAHGADRVEPPAENIRDRVSRLADPRTLRADETAELLAALSTDAGWACAFDELAHSEAVLSAGAGKPGAGDTAAVARARARLTAASDHLAYLVPFEATAARPALIALCALAWWARGLESVAHRQLAEALRIDPEHEVARLALRVIGSGKLATLPSARESAGTMATGASAAQAGASAGPASAGAAGFG